VEEAEEAVAAVDVATTTIAVDVVEDQARTTLMPEEHRKVDSYYWSMWLRSCIMEPSQT
jgi:hypothetical protein